MTLYFVERKLPRLTTNGLVVAQLALLQASRSLIAAGEDVRYLRSTFIPATARCFCAFEATTSEQVTRINDSARFAFTSIEEAIDLPAPSATT